MSNNDVILGEYRNLLELGREQINGTIANDLEEHAEFDKLLSLNRYVYTYYSTNQNDRTYSIEFVVLADSMDAIVKELDKKGFWYCAKNYKTNKYIEKYDPELNNITEKFYMNIDEKDLDRYRLKSLEYPNGWEKVITNNDKGNVITISRDHKIHFLESTIIKKFDSMYNDDNYFLNMFFLPNIKDIVNIDLLSNNVAIIVVEDPEIDRNTLYDELLTIFQNNNDLKKLCVNTRKGGRRNRGKDNMKRTRKDKTKRSIKKNKKKLSKKKRLK